MQPGREYNKTTSSCSFSLYKTAHQRRADASKPKRLAYVFPLIRTLTVGLGISPSPPLAGCKRVADCDCRFGITPTPETTARVYLIAIPERHFALEGIKTHRP